MSLLLLGAGTAAPFTPASLSPVLWLTANPTYVFTDAGTTPAGDTDTVEQWNDRSTNGRNASQSTLANKPILYNLGGGLWCVTFDGIDDALARANFTLSGSYSVVAVLARPWTSAKYAGVFGLAYAQMAGKSLLTTDAGVLDWSAKDLMSVGDGFDSGRAPRAVGSYGALADAEMAVVASTLGASGSVVRLNGASVGTVVADGAVPSTTDTLFVGYTGVSTDFFDGDLSELILFSPALTLAQLQQVENYFNGIYGVY